MTSLREAQQAYRDVASDPRMVPQVLARHELERAERETWERGECCEDRGPCGACRSASVRLARREKLTAGGMGSRGVNVMCELCEHSDEWKAVEMVYRVANETGRVTVAAAAAAIEGVEQ